MSTGGPLLAIVNPTAGGGVCGRRASGALAELREAGLEIDVLETRAAGQAEEMARQAYRQGRRRFLAVGGDGTSFEVVNGLFSNDAPPDPEDRPSLAVLPLGTGNSFLRDFSDSGEAYATASILEGRSRPCDVIRVVHRDGVVHFINIFSIGFVAKVGAMRNRRFSALGEGGYAVATVLQVAGLSPSPFPMRCDGGSMDRDPVTFVAICNSKFTGGKMMMAPEASPSDGEVDVIRVGPLSRISLLRTFPKIFEGTHVHNPAVTTTRARTIDFDVSEELDVLIDGEMVRIAPVRLEVLPAALEVQL